jgi:photosystem II stability/assembly factor-like uncharacterized protein
MTPIPGIQCIKPAASNKLELVAMCAALAALLCSHPARAQTWTQTSAPANSSVVTCSADGRIIAASDGLGLYISTNYGATWITNGISAGYWYAIACSADGTHLAVVGADAVATSKNMGASWQSNSLPTSGSWDDLACSADGSKLALLSYGCLYFSTNAGDTWFTNTAVGGDVVAMSADGSTVVSANKNAFFVSTNSGQSWVMQNGPTNVFDNPRMIAASADCVRLAMINIFDVYTSTNAGRTWWLNGPSVHRAEVYSIASSADGLRLVTECNGLYTSTNSGGNWILNNPPVLGSSISVASSADGSRLVAACNSGIWTSYTPVAPVLDIVPSNNAAKISWLIPGAHYVLEENSDPWSTSWSVVSTVPNTNLTNLHYEVNVPLSGSNAYYRLHLQ